MSGKLLGGVWWSNATNQSVAAIDFTISKRPDRRLGRIGLLSSEEPSMPRCIVKQPNNLYAVWSSVVDDFILLEATAEQVIIEELEDPNKQGYPGGKDALRRDLCREFENIKETGKAWKWAPTWDEAIETIKELHGEKVASDRLAAISS